MTLLYSALTIGITIAALVFGVSLLPDASSYPLPTDITNAITTIFGYVNAWSYLIDINDLMRVIGVIMVVELGVWLFNIFTWLMRLVLRGH